MEVIAVQELSRAFGPVVALDRVTFTLTGPQVVGLLGPNGAGKTTLLDLLEGLQAPDSGSIRLFGAPLDRARYPRRRVGAVLQTEAALDRMSAGDYAALFSAIFAVEAREILSRAGLADRGHVPFERLSGGEAQRLAIAAVSCHGPELLLLDEPTAHLDPGNRRAIGDWLRALGRTRTVVISTHDLAEAEAVCDTVLFLERGRLRAQGSPAALIEAVPPDARTGRGLEDAFFHLCGAHIRPDGDRA